MLPYILTCTYVGGPANKLLSLWSPRSFVSALVDASGFSCGTASNVSGSATALASNSAASGDSKAKGSGSASKVSNSE